MSAHNFISPTNIISVFTKILLVVLTKQMFFEEEFIHLKGREAEKESNFPVLVQSPGDHPALAEARSLELP